MSDSVLAAFAATCITLAEWCEAKGGSIRNGGCEVVVPIYESTIVDFISEEQFRDTLLPSLCEPTPVSEPSHDE